jgi:hypothetical protein
LVSTSVAWPISLSGTAVALELFSKWKPLKGTTFHQFVGRLDAEGGFAVVETDNPSELLDSTGKFAPYNVFQVYPVVDYQRMGGTASGEVFALRACGGVGVAVAQHERRYNSVMRPQRRATMTEWEQDGLRKAAVLDLARAIRDSGADNSELLTVAKAAVDSLTAYIISRLEHDDASRHEPPPFGV